MSVLISGIGIAALLGATDCRMKKRRAPHLLKLHSGEVAKKRGYSWL